MAKCFNVTGACDPESHYMVDIRDRLEKITKMVDQGAYFTINRARQYGKTTTIRALETYLKDKYILISLDFQRLSSGEFETETTFTAAFADYLVRTVRSKRNPVSGLDDHILDRLAVASQNGAALSLRKLFDLLNELCDTADKPVVMIIDEVDSATNNQVFLDFLSQLRADYLGRNKIAAFWSVILAGVTDVKNLKRKIRPNEGHKENSPWNIAKDFNIDMDFSAKDIKGMLEHYEEDFHTGMDCKKMAEMIHAYTSGYPYLVSKYCQLMDEAVTGLKEYPTKASAWTKEGFLEADKLLLSESNTLFESIFHKFNEYPELERMLYLILFSGAKLAYNVDNPACRIGNMFGIIRNEDGVINIVNRTFETRIYNYFMAKEQLGDALYKNDFSQCG